MCKHLIKIIKKSKKNLCYLPPRRPRTHVEEEKEQSAAEDVEEEQEQEQEQSVAEAYNGGAGGGGDGRPGEAGGVARTVCLQTLEILPPPRSVFPTFGQQLAPPPRSSDVPLLCV